MNSPDPDTAVAVVGMAGVFPGASDINRFWENIINKQEAIQDVPPERWCVPPDIMYAPKHAPDKAISMRAALIRDFSFDPNGYELPPDLLAQLDPLYHLVLHAVKSLWSQIKPDQHNGSLPKERTGTILAAIALPTDSASRLAQKILGTAFEERLCAKYGQKGPYALAPLTRTEALSARVTSFPAALLAGALGLQGGTLTLDAACASSLYAVKLACDELQSGRADLMLAGGVSRPDALYTQVGFSQLQALSPSGRCAPFDNSADGLVVGEGIGILALKRLADARRDGDTIYGIIRAVGVSNDMGGNLLAPESEGQLRAMQNAYQKAGWAPDQVDLIECHGAGTPVGDATELKSLKTLWEGIEWSPRQCPIGSVKSGIGHLLTAAGAAGMIKILLALHHKILPPSLNFQKESPQNSLAGSPFRVQTEPEKWERRDINTPRRAAVSAFGFGGINAHLLLEECDPSQVEKRESSIIATSRVQKPDIAIVGMAASFGNLTNLREFQEAVFKGESIIREKPAGRWKGATPAGLPLWGGYMESIFVELDEFRITPNEIPDILPQHLLMLKMGAAALQDAGLPLREKRPRMGTVIGMDFDYEATNFHLRWQLHNRTPQLISKLQPELDPKAAEAFKAALQDAVSPPLTANRTLGALGGIIGSRLAKEFKLGGPSFTVSCEAASGLKALHIGIDWLQANEADIFLIGAVDMAGDVRNLIIENTLRPYGHSEKSAPFDKSATGPLPGEGAVALVIKRLDDALRSGDRIYAVIKGDGAACSGGIVEPAPTQNSYTISLKRSLKESGISYKNISFIETHGSGDPLQDQTETASLFDVITETAPPVALGALKPITGHCGAASGLAALVKTALSLYYEIIPPLAHFSEPKPAQLKESPFHISRLPQYWHRNRKAGERGACVGAMTADGNCAHVVLEGCPPDPDSPVFEKISNEQKRPLGLSDWGLFTITGENRNELLAGLDRLSDFTTKDRTNTEALARHWYRDSKPIINKGQAVSLLVKNLDHFHQEIRSAKAAVSENKPSKMIRTGGVAYTTSPLGPSAEIAFVYPGSGNQYAGMGQGIGTLWPEILRQLDAQNENFMDQALPQVFIPWRTDWGKDWRQKAHARIVADPLNMIFGPVVFGGIMTRLVDSFGLRPQAVIGYSLGESTGLFATGAWPGHEAMLERMRTTDLFYKDLSGPCRSARKAWQIPPEEDFSWLAATLNRPAGHVRPVIEAFPWVRLLIVNTPEECVIGGDKAQVTAAVRKLGCEAIFHEGLVSVHCDAEIPVAAEYEALHLLPTRPLAGVRFYSCAWGRAYDLSAETAAASIQAQATAGFDFPKLINQAYKDGVRIFLELGPQGSCSRMINRILDIKPHLAISADSGDDDPLPSILRFLGTLISEGVEIDLEALYGASEDAAIPVAKSPQSSAPGIPLTIGGAPSPLPDLPAKTSPKAPSPSSPAPYEELMASVTRNMAETAKMHRQFLDLAQELTRTYGETFALQNRLLEEMIEQDTALPRAETLFSREDCLEFAVGSVAKVLGPEFEIIDTSPLRVRLPDEPLMLVDRITGLEGKKCSLGPGRITTEHDVKPGAWYLDGGRAPVCIAVEAGQADLFLCSYLGIDHIVKGQRAYRLLDATVTFHRHLPQPGETVRYEIGIERFARQGETYLFFFHFEGFVGDTHLITMTNGCAGFFTEAEVRNSGGIIGLDADQAPVRGKMDPDFRDLVPFYENPRTEHYDEKALESLRRGDASACFGDPFAGVSIPANLRIPGGRMKLIDRVLELNPEGGRYSLGLIRAEADIDPGAWFLTCHFMDDMVMPGTLMYECCVHTLRIFIQRMGWITDDPQARYEPLTETAAVLKCRGPVTPQTAKVIYEVEIKEIGYEPEPYVIADAHMYADGHYIVCFHDMSLKMARIDRRGLEAFWEQKTKKAFFNRTHLLEFAHGKPSKAFGPEYRVFDRERFIARLPSPPYLFMDRVTRVEPAPFVLKPDGWIEAEFDVEPDGWYFRANRTPSLPYAVLNEIALQPCGLLAAYMGSALKSDKDLCFRNLGGNVRLLHNVDQSPQTLQTRARLSRVSETGDMIIEHFEFRVAGQGRIIYEGTTYFGFFTREALARQAGIKDTESFGIPPEGLNRQVLADDAPLSPSDPTENPGKGLALPARALRMVDVVDAWDPAGGPAGLGVIRASKQVQAEEWFFKAHFFQDPVCPGSLGLESFIQLMKYIAIQKWPDLVQSHRFEFLCGHQHEWVYRGQILPQNRTINMEAAVTALEEDPLPAIRVSGILKADRLPIYRIDNFGITLKPLKGL